jgi:cytidine deaminase
MPEFEQFYRPYEVGEVSPESFQKGLEEYERRKDELIDAAAKDRDNAVSYRGFLVGSSMLSMDMTKPEGEFTIYSGHNYKPGPGEQHGAAKRCAEKQAFEKALANKTKMIMAIVSVSDRIATKEGIHNHDALHPCEECRKMMRQMLKENLLSEESMVCNVNDTKTGSDGKWLREERTVRQILDEYRKEDGLEEEAVAA